MITPLVFQEKNLYFHPKSHDQDGVRSVYYMIPLTHISEIRQNSGTVMETRMVVASLDESWAVPREGVYGKIPESWK